MSLAHRQRSLAVLAGAAALACVAGPLAALPAQAATDHLVINEVYGGGGNSGATYTHDFVELYNGTGAAIDLTGWKVQYFSSAGNLGNTCTLSGSVAAGDYFLIQQAKGTGGTTALPTPDATCTAAMSGTAGSVVVLDASGAQIDLVGYGTATKVETAAAPATTNTTSVTRANGADTDNNSADFTAGAPTPQNGAGATTSPAPTGTATPSPTATTTPTPTETASPAPTGTATPAPTGTATPTVTPTQTATPSPTQTATPSPTVTPTPTPVPITPIAAIQGTGATSPLVGQTVNTVGIVTATYPTGGFNGVYLQTPGTGGTAKAPGDASDGVFLYSTWAATNLQVGQCVQVTGSKVVEYNGLTELSNGFATTLADCAPVVPTELATLPATDAEKEPYEGMLVKPLGTYTITNNYQLNQFGQIGLAVGDQPLYQATDVVAPGAAAEAYEAENQRKYITLDDGSTWDYLRNKTAMNSPLPYLSQEEPMRAASQVTFTQPVILDYRYQWNYQPTGQIVGSTDAQDPLQTENDREFTAPNVGGNAQLATFNVLNYFTDLGEAEDVYKNCPSYNDKDGNPVTTNRCEVRGAWTSEAFEDQKAKIVAAINGTGAEAVALMEVENSAGITWIDHHRDFSLAQLVDALNADARTRGLTGVQWAYAESPVVTPGSEDVIRVAFIYNPNVLKALGPSIIDLDPAFANARYPLAQKFKIIQSGKPFVMVANHFKSKGSGEDDGTGQGLSNPSREAQARQLVAWVKEMFGNQATFLMGDFNAYSQETPIKIIEAAGYTEVVKHFEPLSHSYQFSGRLGSLDHIFANAKAMELVTGAAVWDINADESVAMQYSRRNYNVVDFYQPTPFAASDHDPELVGIRTTR